MKKVTFKAMGLTEPKTGLNHRFRAEIVNKKGEEIFVEFHLVEIHKFSTKFIKAQGKIGEYLLSFSHCFRTKYKETNIDPELSIFESCYKKASKEAVIEFLDDLGCDYTEFEIK